MPTAVQTVSPPPAAPQVTIIEGAPPAPPKPPTSEIHVIPQPVEGKPEPKKGSAMERMRAKLAEKASGGTPPPPAEPETKVEEPGQSSVIEPPAEPGEPPAAGNEPKKKPNPWTIVDQWKARAAAAEAKLAEAAANAVNPAEKAKLEERLATLEATNKELAEELKYEAYVKSPEFKETHEKPYAAAWDQAMSELSELTVIDGGEERPVAASDLLQLVNMKLGDARDLAEEKFGHFANDVMIHRKKIKDLFTAKQLALESARNNSEERTRQIHEQRSRQATELQSMVAQEWNKANDMALADPKAGKFFRPAEGDEETNKRLERGYKMVDEAFSRNALDPSITPEERQKIVMTQASVRHRAAAFGRVLSENVKLEARVAELTERLKQYDDSTPPVGGSLPPSPGAALGGSMMERMKAKLAERAK